MNANRGGPRAARTASKTAAAKPPSLTIVEPEPVGEPFDEWARRLDGAFVVLVRINEGRYRRRIYCTVNAAERAAHNAQQRGHEVVVYLAKVSPLYVLRGPVQ